MKLLGNNWRTANYCGNCWRTAKLCVNVHKDPWTSGFPKVPEWAPIRSPGPEELEKPMGELFRGTAASSSGSGRAAATPRWAMAGSRGHHCTRAIATAVAHPSLHFPAFMLTNLAYPFDQSLVSHSNFLIPTPEYLQTYSTVSRLPRRRQAAAYRRHHSIITSSALPRNLLIASFIPRPLTFSPVVIVLALSTQVTWSLLIQVSLQLFYALFEALTLWQLVLAIV